MEDEKKDEQDENHPGPLFKTPPDRPKRAHISKEEFRQRLKNIGEWRKQRLAELRAEIQAEDSSGDLRS